MTITTNLVFLLLSNFIMMIKCANFNAEVKIAIIGGGFGGLATAWKLSKDKSTDLIHIYDRLQPGFADGSSNSAGIMHPMAPRGGKVIWKGLEGMAASYHLMNQVETRNYGKVYNDEISLRRVIYEEKELLDWKKAGELNPNIVEIINNSYKNISTNPSILAMAKIKYATVVNPVKYLKSLWHGIQSSCNKAEWKLVSVEDLEEISSKYDIVILACGAGILNLIPASKNKIRLVRGQNLLFDRSKLDSYYDFSVGYLNGEYIIPHHHETFDSEYNSDYLICGATHEHITNEKYNSFLTENGKASGMPNILSAENLLNDKLHLINPSLKGIRPFAATAGTRAVTQRCSIGRLPIVGKVPNYENIWLLTGFGSRGLLHHAILSDYLCQAIVANNPDLIPLELQPKFL